MSVNDVSEIVIDDSRVTLQIVASLIVNSRGVVNNHNLFIVQATGVIFTKHLMTNLRSFLKERRLHYENVNLICSDHFCHEAPLTKNDVKKFSYNF